MRDTLWKRCELIEKLGGLSEPKVENREWLYLFSEESRNSIAIEGFFVSEEEFESIVLKGREPRSRSEKEAYNYYRTALYFYSLAYENYKTGEFLFSQSLIRQMAKMCAQQKDYRKGEIRIAGAKIKPPPPYTLSEWMCFYVSYVKENFRKPEDTETLDNFLSFLAKQHTLFESIHPFEDGNGRVGRIIINYLLLSAGLPLVVIKAKEKRDAYIKSLEIAEEPLRELTPLQPFEKEKVNGALEGLRISRLKELLQGALREGLDRLIADMLEKNGYKLLPSEEVAKELKYSPSTIRALIHRGYFIAVKRGKSWWTNPAFDLRRQTLQSSGTAYSSIL